MTFPSAFQPTPFRPVARATHAIVIAVIAMTAIAALTVAGITFVGLAIAFPIAVPVAQHYHVAVSAADAALAERFAQFAWVFIVLAIGSFTAAAAIVVKAISALSPVEPD